ncbi:hypothetical protein Ddye_026991 [Dipteronia dyeriana]|uniref:DUF4408 domain-containing protein n=1 Tax=Dipteronia dyeriana TaxID=168575 RepID=A0AAD9WQ22_9ROSI|nr:hypothetical protein Ddye_026991 [Dipteronia dyeriana]
MSIFSSSGSITFSFKVGLVSTCVLSAAMVLKFSFPLISEFVASDIPVFWNVVLQWLKPPYLYVVINCIIISIVASAKLQQKNGSVAVAPVKVVLSGDVRTGYDRSAVAYDDFMIRDLAPEKVVMSGDVRTGYDRSVAYDDVMMRDLAPEKAVMSGGVRTGYDRSVVYDDDVRDLAPENIVFSGDVRTGGYDAVYKDVRDLSEQENEKKNVGGRETAVEFNGEVDVAPPPPPLPQRSDSMEFLERLFEKDTGKLREKPPASARFSQRKAAKASPEGGKALKVSKSKRGNTLESTWKTITEGRAMPLNRHLKKSDTWDTHVRQNTPPPAPKMKKSDTFNDGGGGGGDNLGRLSRESSVGRLKKEPSLSQDELNRRVEAFIKNFNEDMRLQRQRSLDQYNEMISTRG